MQCIRFSVLLNAFCPSCLLLREESERSHGRIISFSATFALRPLHMAVHFHPVIRFWQTLPLLSSSDLNKSIDFYAYYRSTVTKLLDLPKHWKRCPVLDQIIALHWLMVSSFQTGISLFPTAWVASNDLTFMMVI